MYYLRALILLTLVYLALTSNLQPSNIVVGVLLAVLALVLIRPERKTMSPRDYPRSLMALVRYVATLAADLVISGLQVARVVLTPSLPIRPGVIAIPSDTKSDLGLALSAHAITLTPGNLVVETDVAGVMYTHCLDATDAAETVGEAQQMRRELLDQIFP